MGLNREKALRMKKDVERLRRRGIALEHGRDVRTGSGKDRGILRHEQTKGGQQRRRYKRRCKKACDAAADGVRQISSRGDAVRNQWCQDVLAAGRLFGFGENARPEHSLGELCIDHSGSVHVAPLVF
jgi:hypothetical protein